MRSKITEGDSRSRKEDREGRQAAKDAEIWGLLDSLGAFAAWRPLLLVFEDRDR
jgi:hypothetical protein